MSDNTAAGREYSVRIPSLFEIFFGKLANWFRKLAQWRKQGLLKKALQAVRRHAHDAVLDHPGEADLTSHVDFAALVAEARRHGLDAAVATQGDFLLRMGLLERAGRLGADAGEAARETIRDAVERLAAPHRMGRLFKALCVAPAGRLPFPFSGSD